MILQVFSCCFNDGILSFQHIFSSHVDFNVRINTKLVDPETLQRYEGKAKRVEDLRYIEK